jgi:hypothetical protein
MQTITTVGLDIAKSVFQVHCGDAVAQIGRAHGCTDQQRDVKILLANSEQSTHGT